ncbi:MAG: riboflavin synthase [Deltaproteobacteria bacterium]|nr:riboflavin synthase [Deltaproteobacteria bacterium]
MFTGIIEGTGRVRENTRTSQGAKMVIEAGFSLADLPVGGSVAVSGACLTAVWVSGDTFAADVSPETVSRTTLGRARPGDLVNLERALTLSGRLDGHLVTGHVDGVGEVASVSRQENALLFTIRAPESVRAFLVEKGSVAVEGVSLTVNEVTRDGFSVMVIPHTAKITTLGARGPGDPVNLEADVIAKYVEKFVSRSKGEGKPSGGGGLTLEFLQKSGF